MIQQKFVLISSFCYLAFAKAFDTVAHKRLLLKPQAYGVSCKLLIWMEAFLSGLGDVASVWEPVRSGVPQGW